MLKWIKLETTIATQDKILTLISRRKGLESAAVYMFGLGYCGAHGTDGFIPKQALPMIHGLPAHARALVDVGLWDAAVNGWFVRNYTRRQQTAAESLVRQEAARARANKGNCIRWHGPECGCWEAA